VKIVKSPRAVGETSGLRQVESLEAWAASLKPRQLIAVRADRREHGLEGLYWLAVLRGKPFWPTEETLHCTNRIEAGWLVVAAQWLRLENSECKDGLRSYLLLDAETLIIINHTVRLSGLTLSQGKGGPAGRALRSEAVASRLFYISKDTHHSMESCCSEDQCE
jgi:hypothetical protein